MFAQRIFRGTSTNSAPFLILKAASPCGPEKAVFSPNFTVSRPGAAVGLFIAGWDGRVKRDSFLQEQTGNVIENKGPVLKKLKTDEAERLSIAGWNEKVKTDSFSELRTLRKPWGCAKISTRQRGRS
jgi:hypothetical protein